MESIEHAWDPLNKQRTWGFLADSGRSYQCPKCGLPVAVYRSTGKHSFFGFRHVQAGTCSRYAGVANAAHEAKYLLMYALQLQPHRITVEQDCQQCRVKRMTGEVPYDYVLDPFASGVVLPANFTDNGADLLLYSQGALVAYVGFAPSGTKKPSVPWLQLEPHATIAAALTRIAGNDGKQAADGFVLLDTSSLPRCSRSECRPLAVLATELGWKTEWSSDHDRKTGRLAPAQFVANACTGKVRQYTEWHAEGKQVGPLAAEVERRQQCLACTRRPNPGFLTAAWPFCASCTSRWKSLAAPSYTEKALPAEERQRRLTELKWVRAYAFVKRPEGGHDEPGLPEVEKPCSGCGADKYKPLFFYGYRAVCADCVAADFAERALV